MRGHIASPSHSARSHSIRILSLLTAATALGGVQPAFAAMPGAVADGVPTIQACAQLGFAPPAIEDKDGGFVPRKSYQRSGGIPKMAPTGVPPMPSPSPMMTMEAAPALGGGMAMGQPMAGDIETEKYPHATPNPIKQVAEAPVSTFSIDVDTASYANVRRFLAEGSLPPRDAVRVEELLNYFDYGYQKPASPETPFQPTVSVTPSPWASGKEIVHIGLQGYDVAHDEQPPLNLTFLIDVSGSMDDPDKLPLAQKALNILVDQLRPEDRVSLAVYAGRAGAVLAPTPGNQKLKIRCAINALHAGGSTAGGEGLALAYAMAEQGYAKQAANRVVLMTDGDFNVGVADPRKLEDFVAEKRKTGIYLSAYGLGGGNYNDTMMQTLTQAGNGTAGYIDTLDEARKLFHDDFSSSVFPIADDVKIQVEFNPARVAEYRLIGYETRLLNREDFNNDRVDAGEVGSGAAVTALYEITPVGGPLASDPLRYKTESGTQPPGKGGELAFLKIRYKLPGEGNSHLIERPITDADAVVALDKAPEATRWAVAVAAYGQRLRGDTYMQSAYDWDSILALAQGARGEDAYGLRAEFVKLVRSAETAHSINE
jgi:Ca-activated chloride channel family protein